MRKMTPAATFLLGAACAVGVSHAADSVASVLTIEAAEHRVASHGKAEVFVLARGQEAFLGKLELAPGAAVPEHQDATEEFIFVLEGNGTITIDGVSHDVKPNTAVYMPANATVTYQNGQQRLVALQVFAGPEPAAKYDGWAVQDED